jgi:CheY-like chemotaxis protein
MANKCALIVDDSRTAREVLRRMLEAHELRVETAESAEAALDYLSSHRPDVIFMDHMMPGMDGFQAVKAIKENPATATIPVMMYTSQSGDLYVGQARALGAVGVLPKQIKPVEVTEVLRSLRLLPGSEQQQIPARRASDSPSGLASIESVNSPADWSDLHRWLQEMLADHNRNLRTDLEATVRQVMTERTGPQLPALPASPRGMQLPFWPAGLLVVVLAVAAAVSFWLHLDSETRWRAVARQNLGLIKALGEQPAGSVPNPRTLPAVTAAVPAAMDRAAGIAAALEWSVNQAASYPPDELPFGDARLEMLKGLLERLRALDFQGTVRLESHVGDFCMRRAGDTGWKLAADELPVSRCDRLGQTVSEARSESTRQSVAFANYLSDPAISQGSIRIEIEAFGNTEPRMPYPVAADGVTAGEWNRAARANQRVEIRLLADSAG